MLKELDLFRTTENILMELTRKDLTEHMCKDMRYIFYPRMLNVALDMHELIYHANTWPEERAELLKKYLGEAERLKSLTRIVHERHFITHAFCNQLSILYDSVGKQAAAWRKSTKEKERKNGKTDT